MRTNKTTYFSLFFLFCFLASFSTSIYKNINSLSTKTSDKNGKSINVSTKEENQPASSDLLFEENETENETDFQTLVFTLPFLITCFQYQSFQSSPISAQPLAEKLTTPIYIEVCNFRI